jgi:hypothetical protein
LTVATLKIQQRLPWAHNHLFHLGDEDGVISGVLRSVQPALQVSERSAQDGRTVLRTLEARTRYLCRPLVCAGRTRIVFRDDSLIFAQNVDPETFPGM